MQSSERAFTLQVSGHVPPNFKVAFDFFFDGINTIDRFEDSQTVRAIESGLLKGINVNPDAGAKFYPFVSDGVIHFSTRFMYYLYSFSFALYLLTEHIMRRELDGTWDGRPDSSNEVRWADLYLEYAKKSRDGLIFWDCSLMGPDSPMIAPRDVNAIFAMSMTFIYLHELSHLLLKHDPGMDSDSMVMAEKDADIGALRVFFRGIEDISLRRNRMIAIGTLQAASLFSVTDLKHLKSRTHPDKDVRLAHILQFIELDDQKADYYVKTIVSVGITLFCLDHDIKIATKEFETANDHYEYLLDTIAEMKPE